MRIDMWLDTCDPWSYLGLRHLRSAMDAFDHGDEIEVYLHAYLLDPDLEAALDKPRIVALVESGLPTWKRYTRPTNACGRWCSRGHSL